MSTCVLVHGAWHGAWSWTRVVPILTSRHHRVTAATLTGLGERAGELTPAVTLATHIADIVEAIDRTESPVTVIGHSYGGMVAVGAAALRPRRVTRLVVVDGFLPEAGESAFHLLPERAATRYVELARERGDGWLIPARSARSFGVRNESMIADIDSRSTDQPLATFQASSPASASELGLEGCYVLCTGWPTPFRTQAARAASYGWAVMELDADHEAPVTAPDELASLLLGFLGPAAH